MKEVLEKLNIQFKKSSWNFVLCQLSICTVFADVRVNVSSRDRESIKEWLSKTIWMHEKWICYSEG